MEEDRFFSAKHISILSEIALDERPFIILEIPGIPVYRMVLFYKSIHNGSGFIRGVNLIL